MTLTQRKAAEKKDRSVSGRNIRTPNTAKNTSEREQNEERISLARKLEAKAEATKHEKLAAEAVQRVRESQAKRRAQTEAAEGAKQCKETAEKLRQLKASVSGKRAETAKQKLEKEHLMLLRERFRRNLQ